MTCNLCSHLIFFFLYMWCDDMHPDLPFKINPQLNMRKQPDFKTFSKKSINSNLSYLPFCLVNSIIVTLAFLQNMIAHSILIWKHLFRSKNGEQGNCYPTIVIINQIAFQANRPLKLWWKLPANSWLNQLLQENQQHRVSTH